MRAFSYRPTGYPFPIAYELGACALSERNVTDDTKIHYGRWNTWSDGCKKDDSAYAGVLQHYAYGVGSEDVAASDLADQAYSASYKAIAATTPGRFTSTPKDSATSNISDLGAVTLTLSKAAGESNVYAELAFTIDLPAYETLRAPAGKRLISTGSVALPASQRIAFSALEKAAGGSCGVERCSLNTGITFFGAQREYAVLSYGLLYDDNDNTSQTAPAVKDGGLLILKKQ